MTTNSDKVVRVHFFERQFLRTQEFTTEQDYHLAMRRRHNIAQHIWGIVDGLDVVVEEGNIFIMPGVAVDGYGRELIVPEKFTISTNVFQDKGSDILDVWLLYDRVGSDFSPEGYVSCGNGEERSHYRWLELPQVYLDKPDPAFADRRKPESVPESDREFDPSVTPPDDPQDDWPVFLGQIIRNPASVDQPFSVDPANRPYASLKGEAIIAPSGRAKLQIGAELENDSRRFAIFIGEEDTQTFQREAPFEIVKDGKINIRGDTVLRGDLKINGGAIEFGAGKTESPQPWRIYHHLEKVDGGDKKTTIKKGDQHELRIEMAQSVLDEKQQVVIGKWSSEENGFTPCLTVSDDCSITVNGDLLVNGIIEEEVQTTDGISTRPIRQQAKSALLNAFHGGLTGAHILGTGYALFAVLASLVATKPDSSYVRSIIGKILDTPNGLKTLAAILGQINGEQIRAFAKIIAKREEYSDIFAEIHKEIVKDKT